MLDYRNPAPIFGFLDFETKYTQREQVFAMGGQISRGIKLGLAECSLEEPQGRTATINVSELSNEGNYELSDENIANRSGGIDRERQYGNSGALWSEFGAVGRESGLKITSQNVITYKIEG